MLSMKMATGEEMFRTRGISWLSVSLADRNSSPRSKSSRLTKWSMTPLRLGFAMSAWSFGLTPRPSIMPRRFRTATAIEISQTRFQLSVDSP